MNGLMKHIALTVFLFIAGLWLADNGTTSTRVESDSPRCSGFEQSPNSGGQSLPSFTEAKAAPLHVVAPPVFVMSVGRTLPTLDFTILSPATRVQLSARHVYIRYRPRDPPSA